MRNLSQFDFGCSVSVELTDNKPEELSLTRCPECNNGQLIVVKIIKLGLLDDKILVYCPVCNRIASNVMPVILPV